MIIIFRFANPHLQHPMKFPTIPATAALLMMAAATPAFPQGGPLLPPSGPPSGTMKSLEQIQPHIPLLEGSPGVTIAEPDPLLADGRIIISEPGNYYLTESLQLNRSGIPITIAASNVTLDLMGHSIMAPPQQGTSMPAIEIEGDSSHITIQNGHIISVATNNAFHSFLSRFSYGIRAGEDAADILVRDISIRNTRFSGIILQNENSVVRNCSVVNSGEENTLQTFPGIKAGRVYRSVALATVDTAIEAQLVQDCIAGSGSGGIAIIADRVIRSQARGEVGGIQATTLVDRSEGVSTGSDLVSHGIICHGGVVSHSRGISSRGMGIQAKIVTHSLGIASGNSVNPLHGIEATSYVAFSHGEAASGHGISTLGVVFSSHGETTSQSDEHYGLLGLRFIINSTASTTGNGAALVGSQVINSHGYSELGTGISGTLTLHSYGRGNPGDANAYGIQANKAVGSFADGGESISFKADMP